MFRNGITVVAWVLALAGCAGGTGAGRPDTSEEATMAEGVSAEQHHRIDYVELPVLDPAASKRFYGAAFGWTFQDYGDDYVEFRDGRLTGGFRREARVVTGGPLVILYSRDLEASREAVTAAGGRIVRDVFSFPGGRRFHFADPDGHELAVWSER